MTGGNAPFRRTGKRLCLGAGEGAATVKTTAARRDGEVVALAAVGQFAAV